MCVLCFISVYTTITVLLLLCYHGTLYIYKVYDIKVGPDKDGEVHPLDLTRTYRVATTSFYTYESGDGCTAFSDKVPY